MVDPRALCLRWKEMGQIGDEGVDPETLRHHPILYSFPFSTQNNTSSLTMASPAQANPVAAPVPSEDAIARKVGPSHTLAHVSTR